MKPEASTRNLPNPLGPPERFKSLQSRPARLLPLLAFYDEGLWRIEKNLQQGLDQGSHVFKPDLGLGMNGPPTCSARLSLVDGSALEIAFWYILRLVLMFRPATSSQSKRYTANASSPFLCGGYAFWVWQLPSGFPYIGFAASTL